MPSLRDPVEFCRDLQDRLTGSLTLYCGDRLVAEDLAQEALARTLERWTKVGAMVSPEAWAYKVAFNLARSRFRHSAVERRAHERLRAHAGLTPPALPDTATAIAVRSAVMALPARQRAVIVARFYSGLSVGETAQALGCSPGTVKTHTSVPKG